MIPRERNEWIVYTRQKKIISAINPIIINIGLIADICLVLSQVPGSQDIGFKGDIMKYR